MLSGNGPIYDLFRTWIFGCILWCPFGSLLAPFGLHMPPCWLRLASFWRPFASFSINSGSFWSFGHHFTRRGATFCQHFRLRWHQLAPKRDFGCLVSESNCRHPQDFHILGAFVELDVLTTPNFLKIYLAAANFAKHLNSIDRNLHRRNSSFAERLTHLARCGILPQAT